MRSAVRLLPFVILALLVAASVARGDEAGEPVTYLGEKLLSQADLAVRGEAAGETRLGGGIAILRFRILETLHGREKEESVLLLSSDPGFLPPEGIPAVLFLKRLGAGRYEPLARMDLRGREARTKLETLRKYIEIEAIPDGAKKRQALHGLLMRNLVSGDRFLVWSAARELAHFTERHPQTFTERDAATIRAKLVAASDPLLEELLRSALEHLGQPERLPEADGEPPAPRKPALPVPPELRALEEAWRSKPGSAARRLSILHGLCARHLKHAGPILLEALADRDPTVRELASRNLGEAEHAAAEKPLLALLGREKSNPVLLSAIQALGILGSKKALEPILTFGRDPELLRAVAFAVARIGGPVATEYIRGLSALRAGDTNADREIRDLSEFLLSEDFAKQEAALAKIRRRRLR